MNTNIKILCCYSFDTQIIDEFKDSSKYILFGAGDYKSDKMTLCEDDGENIKDLNKLINEISMHYFAYKNYNKIGNPDYIGFNHYRRNLQYSDSQLTENNVICGQMIFGQTLYDQYISNHIKTDFDLYIELFNKEFPEYAAELNQHLMSKIFYSNNIFIMHKTQFFKYSEFMIKCINICKELSTKIDISARNNYQKRIGGFILERMTSFWLYHLKKNNLANLIVNNIKVHNLHSIHQ